MGHFTCLPSRPFSGLSLVAVLLASTLAARSIATERLVVVGGGKRPADANERFVKWGGSTSAKVLVITWASDNSDPDDFYNYYKKDIVPYQPASISQAVKKNEAARDRNTLIEQINDATAIWFTGGDQNLIMDVLDADKKNYPGDSVLALLRRRYKTGVVFGGTSAGCAVMSDPMLTGEADITILDGSQVKTREGLDALPNVILDQHFMAKGRLLRLMGLMQVHHTKLGMGIDESTALMVEDSRYAEVVGASDVLAMYNVGTNGELKIDQLKPGTHFDLSTRKRY